MVKNIKYRYDDVVNEITRMIDRIMTTPERGKHFIYMNEENYSNMYAIRRPGATVGSVEVIQGVITDIKIYEDSYSMIQRQNISRIDLINLLKKEFVGKQFILAGCK